MITSPSFLLRIITCTSLIFLLVNVFTLKNEAASNQSVVGFKNCASLLKKSRQNIMEKIDLIYETTFDLLQQLHQLGVFDKLYFRKHRMSSAHLPISFPTKEYHFVFFAVLKPFYWGYNLDAPPSFVLWPFLQQLPIHNKVQNAEALKCPNSKPQAYIVSSSPACLTTFVCFSLSIPLCRTTNPADAILWPYYC